MDWLGEVSGDPGRLRAVSALALGRCSVLLPVLAALVAQKKRFLRHLPFMQVVKHI